jgi:hypothetical protein
LACVVDRPEGEVHGLGVKAVQGHIWVGLVLFVVVFNWEAVISMIIRHQAELAHRHEAE